VEQKENLKHCAKQWPFFIHNRTTEGRGFVPFNWLSSTYLIYYETHTEVKLQMQLSETMPQTHKFIL